MRTHLDVAADNLTLWRENAAQSRELRALQAMRLGAEALSQEDVEKSILSLWPKKQSRGAPARLGEIEEQLAFLQGLLQSHPHEAVWKTLALPALSPPPAAPRVVFLDSMFGREALKCFEKLLPHPDRKSVV